MITDVMLTTGFVVGMIVGILIGGAIGYGGRYMQDQVIIKTLESERDSALLAKENMKKEWEEALQKVENTTVMLKDTLAAIEVLKMYQAIDEETKEKLKSLRDTYDDENKPTDDTFNKFKQMVDEINKRNKKYNTGAITTTQLTTEQLYKSFVTNVIEAK